MQRGDLFPRLHLLLLSHSSILMLPRFAPRLLSHSQILRPVPLGALPRYPVFFSTTARRFNAGSPGQDNSRTRFPEAVVAPTDDTESESESTLSNQIVTPVSVSFTVSPPPTISFLKPAPVVLLTGPFGGNWYVSNQWCSSSAVHCSYRSLNCTSLTSGASGRHGKPPLQIKGIRAPVLN